MSINCDHGVPILKECPRCDDEQKRAIRKCNRHDDCREADANARALGRLSADHCNDDCCEDCFGS